MTTTEDSKAYLWQADGIGEPEVLRGVDSASFSPDGRRLITTDGEGATIRLWRGADIVAWLGERTTATLTPPERELWLLEGHIDALRNYASEEYMHGRTGEWPVKPQR